MLIEVRPRIDLSRIPAGQRSLPEMLRAEKALQDRLMRPCFLKRLAAHEAGHLHYFTEISNTVEICPAALYLTPSGFLRQYEGGVSIKNVDRHCDENRLLIFAKGIVAGALAEARYAVACGESIKGVLSEFGAEDDVRRFHDCCNEIRQASPNLNFDDGKLAEEATRSVETDFRDAAVVAKLVLESEHVAEVLRGKMYPAVDVGK